MICAGNTHNLRTGDVGELSGGLTLSLVAEVAAVGDVMCQRLRTRVNYFAQRNNCYNECSKRHLLYICTHSNI